MWYLFIKLYYIGKSQFILFFTSIVQSMMHDICWKIRGQEMRGKWWSGILLPDIVQLYSYMLVCIYLPIYHQLDCNRRKECYSLGFSWQKETPFILLSLLLSAKPWKIIIINIFWIFFKEWKISWHKIAIGTLFHKNNDYFFVSIFSSKFVSPPLDLCSLYSSEIDLFSNQ